MTLRRILVLISLLALVACSQTPTGARRAATPSSPAATAKRPSARSLAAAPPVRMFAGVQSALGALQRFCRGGTCRGAAGSVPRVTAPRGSVVTFAVEPAPDQAVLDVNGAGGGRTSLITGTLMAMPTRLAPGPHRLMLQLRWGSAAGTWAFDVVVKAA